MTNKLPEKLTALRKHFSFAQADVAEKTNVPVNEYMNWENGNTICSITQLKKLAELYKVPLIDLLDNTKTVTLPDPEILYASVEIPFIEGSKEDVNYNNAIELDEDVVQRIMEETHANEVVYEDAEEETIENTAKIAQTRLLKAVELKEPTKPKPQPKKVSLWDQVKGKLPWILGALAVLLVLVFGFRFLFGRKSNDEDVLKLSLSDTNRLALADQFSVYVDNNNQIVSSGNTPDLSAFKDIVQVSAGSNHVVGLKKDGTVVCTGATVGCSVKDWKKVTMIATGDTHTVALHEDGTVSCAGGTVACAVQSWEDMDAVYAGGDITVGRTKEGTLKIAGNVNAASKIQNAKDVAQLVIGNNQIVVVNNDGSVACYATGTGSTTNTSSWQNMKMAAQTSQYVAGLNNNGMLTISSSDETLLKSIQNWTGIRYIAARNNTLVAVNANHEIIGIGDNTYNQYGSGSSEADPSATAEAKLGPINNVRFSTTTAGLTITWDEVPNTDYYEVKINTTPEITMNSVRNSVSVGYDRLVDGTQYAISITPCSRDLTKAQNGDTQTVTHTYQAASIQLGQPGNVSASQDGTTINVHWDGVENAEFYNVTIETMTQRVNETKISIDGSHMEDNKEYTIFVTAMSSNPKYGESDAGVAKITYKAPVIKSPLTKPVVISASVNEQNDWIIKFTTDENANQYLVTVNEKTYAVKEGQVTINPKEGKLTSGTEYLVTIVAVPKDSESFNESQSQNTFTYVENEPSPEPIPDPTQTPEENEEESEDKNNG